jgi:predicted N-acetyltransferase YhbS
MTPVVRPIAERDWPEIVALESEVYRDAGLSESPEALASRAAPATSFVLDAGGEIAGYLMALPYPRCRCPDLTRAEETAYESANVHLHDLVVAGRYRRTGLGGRLLRHLVAAAGAQAYEMISLVSVGGSRRFWSAHGFRPHLQIAPPGSYGPDATYMSRPA